MIFDYHHVCGYTPPSFVEELIKECHHEKALTNLVRTLGHPPWGRRKASLSATTSSMATNNDKTNVANQGKQTTRIGIHHAWDACHGSLEKGKSNKCDEYLASRA